MAVRSKCRRQGNGESRAKGTTRTILKGIDEGCCEAAPKGNRKGTNRDTEISPGLINDILGFSKIEDRRSRLEENPFDLRALIEDLADSFAMRPEKQGLELVPFIAPGVPCRLVGDPDRLRRVIDNLARNSLKFIEKGEVFIRVEAKGELDDEVVLRFGIRGTGIGIPSGKQKEIVEGFTQAYGPAARKYGGTGRGLAVSKRIVEAMGGRIEMESVEGQGSAFSFMVAFKKQKDR